MMAGGAIVKEGAVLYDTDCFKSLSREKMKLRHFERLSWQNFRQQIWSEAIPLVSGVGVRPVKPPVLLRLEFENLVAPGPPASHKVSCKQLQRMVA